MITAADIIARVGRACPGLDLHQEERGDLLGSERWGALLSPPDPQGNRIYRYLLWRLWDDGLPVLLVVMLNPSTADHLADDRTVAGLVRRARRFGYGGIIVANCFAFRAKDPPDMKRSADPVGPDNDMVLAALFEHDADLLCAWGANATHRNREKEVRCAISRGRVRPHALRLCDGGAPEHPLYVPAAIAPAPWQPMPSAA